MKVLILMGSDSDMETMAETKKTLDQFDIDSEITIASAHRTPDRVRSLVEDAERKGVEVIIAGAGMAAHLAGVVASHTVLPVIGVPISSSPLDGLDSLLSTVQMPPGIPVATVAIGKPGAKNAGVLAAEIMAVKDTSLAQKLRAYRAKMAEDVVRKAENIKADK